jgi:hypothetical protein
MTERRLTPQERYDRAHIRRITLKLNITHDADILSWLDSQANKQGAIKRLVREQIEREKNH